MIGFCGLSHLGIVTSIAVASKGFKVLCFDSDPEKTKQCQNGNFSLYEPGLLDLFEKSRKNISFTSSINELKSCDVIYVAKDVPTNQQNQSDLEPIRSLFFDILKVASPASCIVILSQVPPGFVRGLRSKVENTLVTRRLEIIYQVETLIFGDAVKRALHPERYIVGMNDPKLPLAGAFDALLRAFDCPILPMQYESAELAKIAINICLISALTVTNTLSELCEKIGANWHEIEPALRLDKRIGQHAYIKPGLGIAGGNLERDLITLHNLLQETGGDAGMTCAWVSNLNSRRDWVLKVLYEEVLTANDSPTIALWGLSYKAGTHSVKNSPALEILEALSQFKFKVYDPKVRLGDKFSSSVKECDSPLAAAKNADVLILMTPWDEFKEIDLKQLRNEMRGAVIIDPFMALSPSSVKAEEFHHFCLGTSARYLK